MPINRVVTATALAVGGYILSKKISQRDRAGKQHAIEESIEVKVPRHAAYEQWTRFEEFPSFMQSVKEVRRQDERHLHWKANIGGQDVEWDAEITEQAPDKRIAWRSTGGVHNSGSVAFTELPVEHTRITLKMAYQPEGATEKLGDLFGTVRQEARANLQRFKDMMEAKGKEGGWRGQISQH